MSVPTLLDADSSDESEYLSLGHISIIVGVVAVLIALQIIGCFVCCRDRWQSKRKLSRNQMHTNSSPLASVNTNNPIEISQVLTTAREPKKLRPKSQVEETDEEAGMPLMTRELPNDQNNQNREQSVVQVHNTNRENPV